MAPLLFSRSWFSVHIFYCSFILSAFWHPWVEAFVIATIKNMTHEQQRQNENNSSNKQTNKNDKTNVFCFISALLLSLFAQSQILGYSVFRGWAGGRWGSDPFNTSDLWSVLSLSGICLHSLKSKLKTHVFSSTYCFVVFFRENSVINTVILPTHHQQRMLL